MCLNSEALPILREKEKKIPERLGYASQRSSLILKLQVLRACDAAGFPRGACV